MRCMWTPWESSTERWGAKLILGMPPVSEVEGFSLGKFFTQLFTDLPKHPGVLAKG